jgi:hypothetical protein
VTRCIHAYPVDTQRDQDATKVTITIYHIVGDDSEEWVVSDDGGEFDDEIFSDREGFNGEAEARDDAACRAVDYQKMGRAWVQEEVK